MTNALCGLGDIVEEVHNLVYTPLEGCRDLFVHEGLSSRTYDNVFPNPLEHAHVSIVSSPRQKLDRPQPQGGVVAF